MERCEETELLDDRHPVRVPAQEMPQIELQPGQRERAAQQHRAPGGDEGRVAGSGGVVMSAIVVRDRLGGKDARRVERLDGRWPGGGRIIVFHEADGAAR